MNPMTWERLDWEVLDRLRETFLTGSFNGSYWHTITDLECYDFTYGERIGWKWDAVLGELRRLGWTPPAGAVVLDWGCGSGIAGRRVLAAFGAGAFGGVLLHDQSPLAMDFAEWRARQEFHGLEVARASVRDLRGDAPIGLLVVSHVLNELDERSQAELAELCARAEVVLWVEPGTHACGRALGAWRERLRGVGFAVVAPCPHGGPCGMLKSGNERHWCHFFGEPPKGVYADSGWVKFAQRAGIDLRSLPYSFLALDRRGARASGGSVRLVGGPRVYKGFARLFGCTAEGVGDYMLQKRDDPEFFKLLKRGDYPPRCTLEIEGDRITRVVRVD